MNTSKKKRPLGEAQIGAFRAIARELGCDESEASFDAKLEKVARAAVPRKPAARSKLTKRPKAEKISKAAKVSAPAKKRIRFNLPGA